MAVRKFLAAVCGAAVVGAAMLASAGTASAQPPFGGFPGNPYYPPVYNPGFAVPLPGGGIDRVQFTPTGVVQDIITPQGRIDIYNGYNGKNFEVIQPNYGTPVFFPF